MIKPVWTVFAIVTIGVMMGASTVAPAFAAELTVNTNSNLTVGPFLFVGGFVEVCGVKPVHITVTTILNEKEWDNNNFNRHTLTTTTFTDGTGNIVGSGTAIRSEVGEFEQWPLRTIVQDNNKFSCTNGESDAVFEVDTHEGHTTFKTEEGVTTHEANHGPPENPGNNGNGPPE